MRHRLRLASSIGTLPVAMVRLAFNRGLVSPFCGMYLLVAGFASGIVGCNSDDRVRK
jgi:hypothetical protein